MNLPFALILIYFDRQATVIGVISKKCKIMTSGLSRRGKLPRWDQFN